MPVTQSTPGGEPENEEDLPEQEILTKTRVMLAELPITPEDIQAAILELATQIQLEEQQKLAMSTQFVDPQALATMQQVQV